MSYSPQRTSPPSSNSPSRQLQSYQQHLQHQQQQQQQQHQQQQLLQYQQYQQHQQQQQQQHLQSLAVWSPSVPTSSLPPSSPSSPSASQGPVNISGPLDLKTSAPQPILPPVKNTLPPPRPGGSPSRSASLRRQLSQNSSRPHGASSSQSQTHSSNDLTDDNNGRSQDPYNHSSSTMVDGVGAEHRPSSSFNSNSPQYSGYSRTLPSTPGSASGSGSSSAHSSGYFDGSKSGAQPDSSSLLSVQSSPGLQRSNSKVNYSSPLLRSHSRSGGSSPASSPSQSLKRQTSILKNGSKDAPYLSSSKSLHSVSETLNQSWEPSGPPNSAGALSSTSGSPPASGGQHSSLSQFGSASNLRAIATAAAAAASAAQGQDLSAQEAAQSTSTSAPTPAHAQSGGPGSHGATTGGDATGTAQPLSPQQELKDQEASHAVARDSANYKVLVPPSPVVSPRVGPTAGGGNQNTFNFLNSDPTLSRSSSRRRMAPPIQVPSPQQQQQQQQQQHQQQYYQQHQHQQPHPTSALASTGLTSPVSPGRRHPYHRWENVLPHNQSAGDMPAQSSREFGQGQGQDQQEDGDYEDEGGNDDTDGDVLSGPEDQGGHRRRQHSRQRSGVDDDVPFTPTRSAPQPPNFTGAVQPNARQAEIAHIMYIQQQQALFLQEKAMNPPLRAKTSNGNLSGGGSDSSKPKRKASRHRKQISVISEPKLLSSTNQIKTVPIVRPADQSDNEDAGMKSEYTSGGEGIKSTVRRMRKAVRHAANGVFNDDDSDREEALGSKSDAEKKGGLKQLKALKSKLAKKLHRPSHGGTSSSSRMDNHGSAENTEGENSRAPVQFFSEDNLRARYLAQEQQGGLSLAGAGASLRRSNTTRDNTAGPSVTFKRPGAAPGEGDKQEYDSADGQGAESGMGAKTALSPEEQEEKDAAMKAKMTKFGSRTFDKEEMMEVKDGTGESFFVPRWDMDPRADELGSSKSVISVQSSKKLERSASSSTATSTKTNKLATSIAERLQGAAVAEEGVDHGTVSNDTMGVVKDEAAHEPITGADEDATIADKTDHSAQDAKEKPLVDPKLIRGESASEIQSPALQAEQETSTAPSSSGDSEQGSVHSGPVSVASTSEPHSRASVLSEASNGSSVGGIVVAQVLTRQSSMRRNFKRPNKGESTENDNVKPEVGTSSDHREFTADQQLPHFGLGISLPSPSGEAQPVASDEVLGGESDEKQLPPLPHDGQPEASSVDPKPLGIMTVRPLSPIRRGTAQSGKTSSIASVSSALSSPSTPPVGGGASSASLPVDASLAQETATRTGVERKSSQTNPKLGLRALSLSGFSLPQAPTSPLPSPSLPLNPLSNVAPPTAPFPGVLTRQGSHLTERASIRSMYADSIYDCYDYDSASDYENVAGEDASRGSRQGSFSSPQAFEDRSSTFIVSLDAPKEEQEYEMGREIEDAATTHSAVAEGASDLGTTSTTSVSATAAERADVSIVAVALNNEAESSKRSSSTSNTEETESEADGSVAGAQDVPPVIRLRGPRGSSKEEIMVVFSDEEHHVLYEELPTAVPYRMSMAMTTVPVDPIGVAAPVSSENGLLPSRPPRHPMRQSRHGSIGTLSIGGSSDFTASDSWISSSVRNTRDDLSGWDVEGSIVDEDASERGLERRDSASSNNSHRISVASASTGLRQSLDGRSERTMSIMTDRSQPIGPLDPVQEKEAPLEGPVHDKQADQDGDAPSIVSKKQWHQQRETWGSLQTSSSDSATTSSSSSRSSHFYFNGRSPSPSPTEEKAPATQAF